MLSAQDDEAIFNMTREFHNRPGLSSLRHQSEQPSQQMRSMLVPVRRKQPQQERRAPLPPPEKPRYLTAPAASPVILSKIKSKKEPSRSAKTAHELSSPLMRHSRAWAKEQQRLRISSDRSSTPNYKPSGIDTGRPPLPRTTPVVPVHSHFGDENKEVYDDNALCMYGGQTYGGQTDEDIRSQVIERLSVASEVSETAPAVQQSSDERVEQQPAPTSLKQSTIPVQNEKGSLFPEPAPANLDFPWMQARQDIPPDKNDSQKSSAPASDETVLYPPAAGQIGLLQQRDVSTMRLGIDAMQVNAELPLYHQNPTGRQQCSWGMRASLGLPVHQQQHEQGMLSPRRLLRKKSDLSVTKYAGKKAETKGIMEHAHVAPSIPLSPSAAQFNPQVQLQPEHHASLIAGQRSDRAMHRIDSLQYGTQFDSMIPYHTLDPRSSCSWGVSAAMGYPVPHLAPSTPAGWTMARNEDISDAIAQNADAGNTSYNPQDQNIAHTTNVEVGVKHNVHTQQGSAGGEGSEDASVQEDSPGTAENASSGIKNASPRRRVRKSVALSFTKYAGKKAETKAIMEHAHTDKREKEEYRRGKKAVVLSSTKYVQKKQETRNIMEHGHVHGQKDVDTHWQKKHFAGETTVHRTGCLEHKQEWLEMMGGGIQYSDGSLQPRPRSGRNNYLPERRAKRAAALTATKYDLRRAATKQIMEHAHIDSSSEDQKHRRQFLTARDNFFADSPLHLSEQMQNQCQQVGWQGSLVQEKSSDRERRQKRYYPELQAQHHRYNGRGIDVYEEQKVRLQLKTQRQEQKRQADEQKRLLLEEKQKVRLKHLQKQQHHRVSGVSGGIHHEVVPTHSHFMDNSLPDASKHGLSHTEFSHHEGLVFGSVNGGIAIESVSDGGTRKVTGGGSQETSTAQRTAVHHNVSTLQNHAQVATAPTNIAQPVRVDAPHNQVTSMVVGDSAATTQTIEPPASKRNAPNCTRSLPPSVSLEGKTARRTTGKRHFACDTNTSVFNPDVVWAGSA